MGGKRGSEEAAGGRRWCFGVDVDGRGGRNTKTRGIAFARAAAAAAAAPRAIRAGHLAVRAIMAI